MVYVGPGSRNGQLWVKRRDRFNATPLAGTDGARVPSASANGQQVVYTAPGGGGFHLREIPIAGGPSTIVADSVNLSWSTGAAWLADGSIVYVDTRWRLRRIPAGGGTADSGWAPPRRREEMDPRMLPGSRGVLFRLCDTYCRDVRDIGRSTSARGRRTGW